MFISPVLYRKASGCMIIPTPVYSSPLSFTKTYKNFMRQTLDTYYQSKFGLNMDLEVFFLIGNVIFSLLFQIQDGFETKKTDFSIQGHQFVVISVFK